MIALDWLSVTYVSQSDLSDFDDFCLKFPELKSNFIDNKDTIGVSMRSHYRFSFRYKDTVVFQYDPQNSKRPKGCFIQCPSSGLATLADMIGVDNYESMLDYFLDRGAKISRLDLCWDDYSKKYTPKWYCFHQFRGSENLRGFRSLCKNFSFIHGNGGDTFYCGSLEKRQKLLRIYDKAAESHGDIDAIRYEFELHGDYAMEVAKAICNETFNFQEYFLQTLTVLDQNSRCDNCSEAPVDKEWIEWFTENVDCVNPDLHIDRRIKIRDKAKSVLTLAKSRYIWEDLSVIRKNFGEDFVLELIRQIKSDLHKDPSIQDFETLSPEILYDIKLDIMNSVLY